MTEYLDVLDENNQPLGIIKSKDDIHRDGDWHACVQVFAINNDNEILLQKRSATKISTPNTWDNAVAGHVLAGETPMEAAIREINEELGILVGENDLELMFKTEVRLLERKGAYINNQHNHHFLMKIDKKIDEIKIDPEEVAEVRYLTLEVLADHFSKKTMDIIISELDFKRSIEYFKRKVKKESK